MLKVLGASSGSSFLAGMQLILLVSGLIASTGHAFGKSADELSGQFNLKSCSDTALTQRAMNECAGAEAHAAEEQLNRSYQAVLCYLEPSEKAALVASERAWIAFRDADCAFWGGGGSDSRSSRDGMDAAYCRAQLSRDRAKELDGWPPSAPRSAISPVAACSSHDEK
jgi:uncharacterized protein YecT (DUF1311 family)